MVVKLKGIAHMNTKSMAAGLLMLLLLGAASAQATQTCRSDLNAATPSGRFVNNGDGTVTDAITNLTWKRCSEGLVGNSCESGTVITYTWSDAIKAASAAVFAGKKDWRIPTIQELDSIIEYKCTMPAINAEIFPVTRTSNYWSSTPFAGYPGGSWNINFNDGAHESCSRNWNLYLRLVRGGNLQEGVCR